MPLDRVYDLVEPIPLLSSVTRSVHLAKRVIGGHAGGAAHSGFVFVLSFSHERRAAAVAQRRLLSRLSPDPHDGLVVLEDALLPPAAADPSSERPQSVLVVRAFGGGGAGAPPLRLTQSLTWRRAKRDPVRFRFLKRARSLRTNVSPNNSGGGVDNRYRLRLFSGGAQR